MQLKDYEFGFADATKEYVRKPEIFKGLQYFINNSLYSENSL